MEFFLYNDASDIGGYRQLLVNESTQGQETISVAIPANATLIEDFATDSGIPNITFLATGIYSFHIHASSTVIGDKDARIYCEIYTRTDPGGVETLRLTTEESGILTAVNTHYEIHASLPIETTINATDRLVIKVYGNVEGAGGNPTVSIYMEGTTASRIDILGPSFTRDHGSLSGLADDDHTQYSLADGSRDYSGVIIGVDPVLDQHLVTKIYADTINASGILASGVYPHHYLTELDHDDHPQYYNAARHDKALHDALALSHDSLSDVSVDDHHAQSHNIASHSDTTATGAELNTLTDGSDADGLHAHAVANAHIADGTIHFVEGAIDHGSIAGLGDNDHTQYVLRQPTADTVINEAGGDFDWRMEGVGHSALFFVDAGNDCVGIGYATPFANSIMTVKQKTGQIIENPINSSLVIFDDDTSGQPHLTFRTKNASAQPGSVAKIGAINSGGSGEYFGNLIFATRKTAGDDMKERVRIDEDGYMGIGTGTPSSAFHIKAGLPGVVGSHFAGQLIIQSPTDSVLSNVVITAYESDGSGNPDQQLWYLGSASGANSDITYLNRRNSLLTLGTNNIYRITILGNGDVGIATATPDELLHVNGKIKVEDRIINVTDPVDPQDAMTLKYFDDHITASGVFASGIYPHHYLTELDHDDHPQYLLADGTRALTGNMAVDPGVTIDGVDISVHAANVDAHHSEVHVVNSTGPHAEAGLTIGHVLRVSGAAAFSFAGLIAADIPQLDHGGLAGLADDDHTQYLLANGTRDLTGILNVVGTQVITPAGATVGLNVIQANASSGIAINQTGAAIALFIVSDIASAIYAKANASEGYVADFFNDGNSLNRYGIRIQCGRDDNTLTNTHIAFADGNGDQVGTVTSTGGATSYNCLMGHPSKVIDDKDYAFGTIMINKGAEELSKHWYKKKWDLQPYEPMNIVEPSTVEKDGRVFGIYSGRFDKEKHQIYTVGRTFILVCNGNGNIENGDYITTSNKKGHGMKQGDDLLHNYTIAKSCESVVWDDEDKNEKLIACTLLT